MTDPQPTDLDEARLAKVKARAKELCRLADGSPCTGPETDCDPTNCFVMERADQECKRALTWPDWSAELVRLGGDRYGPRGVIEECGTGPDGKSAWRGYYESGYSPADALAEDASYAE